MGIPRSPGRLAALAGTAAVVLGLLAGGPPAARAQGQLGPVFNPSGAVSWGYNGYGDLGDGTTTGRSLPGPVSGLTSGVVQVAAGFDHSLALRSDGTVWAWGGNDHGQAGTGTAGANQLTPVQVAGLTGVTKIAAGQKFSLALRSDGTVWAWGLGNQGQLGNSAAFDSAVPLQTWLTQVTSIAAGWDAAYAVRSNSARATVWSWGGDTCGDLGLGATATGTTPMVTIPQPVIGITTPNIVQVSGGRDYALALGRDGQVWGWGADKPGSQVSYRCPVTAMPVVAAGSGITQLSPGQIHVLALAGGIVIAWGDNGNGALGTGSTAPVAGMVHVVGLSGVTQVASGGALFSLAVYSQPQGSE